MEYKQVKDARITFRLTRDEDRLLRKIAADRGVKPSRLVYLAVKRFIRRAA